MKKGLDLRLFLGLVVFILVALIIYSFIHEISHAASCKIVGLNPTINISLFQKKPIFGVDCLGINEKSNFEKFLFWGSPYIISLLFMISIFLFLKKDNLYLVAIPSAILLVDMFNVFGLYEWTYKIGQSGNDLLNILFKTNKVYFSIIACVLGLTTYFFILNLINFVKLQALNISRSR
jgi:hypothetical protein